MDDIRNLVDRMRRLLGDRAQTAAAVLEEHANDASHHRDGRPDIVVFPHSTDEVSAIAGLCSELRQPIIPYGTGTAVEGGVVPTPGGVCVALTQMRDILRVSVPDMDCTVQSGVTRYQLNDHLDEINGRLLFPVDPGADASLGGMAATRASGSAAVRYGTMREQVLGLTVVLADGRVVKTGSRARKSSAGYDLTHLFVGSEGTLGLITEVTLRLVRKPQSVSAAVCPFPSIDAAVDAAIAVMSEGISVARIELLDETQIAAINDYSQMSLAVAPTLFFEFHGNETGVAEDAEQTGHIARRHGSSDFQWAAGTSERDRLWQARYDAYYASLALREGATGYVTDVCVPISALAECIARTRRELESTAIPAPLFGHVGDGNFHVVFAINRDDPQELREVQELSRRIVTHALDLGGTCSGEHGIGLGKRDELETQYPNGVEVMRSIKAALDPHNLLNPGKVLNP